VVAELLAPGHPLFDAVTDVTVERYERVLTAGTVLVDRSDPGDEVRMLAALREEVIDGHRPPRTVSKRFGFVELLPGGEVRATGSAPYLDYEVPSPDDLSLLGAPALLWSGASPREQAVSWSVEHGMPAHLEQVRARTVAEVDRTRTVVRQRLGQEVEHWRTESQVLAGQMLAGRKVRLRPDTAAARARDLERRLAARLAELDLDLHLQARPPVPAALALVVPYGLLERLRTGRVPTARTYRRDTREVEMRAVHATLAAERALGRRPEVMPHNNPGFDIRSRGEDGRWVFIEVKGRTLGAEDFHVTRTEVLKGKNAERYRLSLVSVHPDGAAYDDLRYLEDPFCGVEFDDLSIASITWKWREKWGQGAAPH
jgi:hypothetical protein